MFAIQVNIFVSVIYLVSTILLCNQSGDIMALKMKIVADSSSDVLKLEGVDFESAPLKIITNNTEYVDDENLDVDKMVSDLSEYSDKSGTACPGVEDWLKAFSDADRVFCVTITSALSGSYNSACVAKQEYEEMYPDRKVCVIDSLSAGPEIGLIIEKISELIAEGNDFEEICKSISEYQTHTGVVFMLQSLRNLANNGRVSKIVAGAAGILNIRVLGKASDKGTLEPMAKKHGERLSLPYLKQMLEEQGYKGGKIRISHCCNESSAQKLKELIQAEFKKAKIEIGKTRGLCSYYAEKGGLLIGFEKNLCTT